MTDKNIRREITGIEQYMNPGWQKSIHVGGTYHFKLECGHEHYRKISAGVPKSMKVRCTDCEKLRDGAKVRRGDVRQTWDADKQWPIFTEIKTDE